MNPNSIHLPVPLYPPLTPAAPSPTQKILEYQAK